MLSLTAPAYALTAEQAFDDGNRLFRDDLYWAALLRYRQAADAGLNSPLLHYNTGIAHYKADQHIRAREHLLKALDSMELRPSAQFNLGLNAYASGDPDDALRWFRLARDQQQSEKISQYARIAISRIRTQQIQDDPVIQHVEEQRRKRDFANFELRARVGFGTDSNAFRTPNEPYVDLSDPNLPLITPEPQSGAFIPVSLSAKYNINSFKYEGFFAAYRMAARYYQDKELENANESIHEASIGNDYDRTDGTRRRQVYSAFKVAKHDEVYFDPDFGNERVINGITIADRMNYVRYGPEITFRQSHERLAVGLRIKGQLWNYEDVILVPEYDHEYFVFGLHGQYRFTKTSLLRVTVDKSSRRFGDRPSFDLNGDQIAGAPPVRYDYLDFGLTARQRVTRDLWFGVNFKWRDRDDRYVGYNNYTRNSFGLDLHWSPGNRFDVEASGIYRLYDFENAFAFHDPAGGRKTLESAEAAIIGTFRMTQSLSLVVEGRYRENVSNDLRLQYDRNMLSLGVRWQP